MLRLLLLADCRLTRLVARPSGVRVGYADKKPESQWRSGSFPESALVIQTFRGHANLGPGPDECGTLVMDAG